MLMIGILMSNILKRSISVYIYIIVLTNLSNYQQLMSPDQKRYDGHGHSVAGPSGEAPTAPVESSNFAGRRLLIIEKFAFQNFALVFNEVKKELEPNRKSCQN